MTASGDVFSRRYEVLTSIGSGGMQDVFLAKDKLVERQVALKTPQLGQKQRRFRNSAIIAARVNHHNVAKTYDYGEDHHTAFLVEEYVEGSTLEGAVFERLKRLDPHLGARIFLDLVRGLAASHNVGVAHRDLKPSNVLVEQPTRFGKVKITDFGIATLTEDVMKEAVSNNQNLTASTSKTIQGALPYMAPEMMFRKPGDVVGEEADIWSLGALMFHLLAGEYAFGEGFQAAVNVSNGTMTQWPLFMTSKSQYAPLSLQLQDIVKSCLVFDKTKRPTAKQLQLVCEGICFYFSDREDGIVVSTKYNDTHGTISCMKGDVFFHKDSVYGVPKVGVGDLVSFTRHPGTPYMRAHPVIPRLV